MHLKYTWVSPHLIVVGKAKRSYVSLLSAVSTKAEPSLLVHWLVSVNCDICLFWNAKEDLLTEKKKSLIVVPHLVEKYQIRVDLVDFLFTFMVYAIVGSFLEHLNIMPCIK